MTIPVGAENNLLAIGRVTSLGVVAARIGQALEARAVGVRLENVHVGVEVPLIPPAPALLFLLIPELVFLGVMLARLGIEVRAGKEDLLAVGGEVTACGLAETRTHPAVLASIQVHH